MQKPIINVRVGGYGESRNAPCVFRTVNLLHNLPITEQVTDENVKYVVRWIFDLKGQTLEIPQNCIMEFDGGRIINGSIVWNNTKVLNLYAYDILDVEETGQRLTLGGND